MRRLSLGSPAPRRARPPRRAAVLLVIAAAAAPRAGAQRSSAPPVAAPSVDTARAATADDAPDGTALPAAAYGVPDGWDVAPYVGYGARSPVRFWGLTPGRNHLMVGVQFVRAFARVGAVDVAYAPNVVPLFVLTNNPLPEPDGTAPEPGRQLGRREPSPACEASRCGPVYGVGAAPLGLRLETRLGSRVRVYGAAAAGLVYFSRNVPVRDARRLNATAEWGGGAVVGAASGVAAQLGFKYHHLSNAYTAARNPGVDGRVFYAGVLWRVGGRDVRRGTRPSHAAP